MARPIYNNSSQLTNIRRLLTYIMFAGTISNLIPSASLRELRKQEPQKGTNLIEHATIKHIIHSPGLSRPVLVNPEKEQAFEIGHPYPGLDTKFFKKPSGDPANPIQRERGLLLITTRVLSSVSLQRVITTTTQTYCHHAAYTWQSYLRQHPAR